MKCIMDIPTLAENYMPIQADILSPSLILKLTWSWNWGRVKIWPIFLNSGSPEGRWLALIIGRSIGRKCGVLAHLVSFET